MIDIRVIDSCMIDSRIIDLRMIDNHVSDDRVIDSHMIDNCTIDSRLTDSHVIDSRVIDSCVIDSRSEVDGGSGGAASEAALGEVATAGGRASGGEGDRRRPRQDDGRHVQSDTHAAQHLSDDSVTDTVTG